jgi:hypothetical protein
MDSAWKKANARMWWGAETCDHGRQKGHCKDCGGIAVCIARKKKKRANAKGGSVVEVESATMKAEKLL